MAAAASPVAVKQRPKGAPIPINDDLRLAKEAEIQQVIAKEGTPTGIHREIFLLPSRFQWFWFYAGKGAGAEQVYISTILIKVRVVVGNILPL